MKKSLFLISMFAIGLLSGYAQDDVYFVPKKGSKVVEDQEELSSSYRQLPAQSSEQDGWYSNRRVNRDVDAYNRRKANTNDSSSLKQQRRYEDEEDNGYYTERLIRFHAPGGVIVTSPYYWDYCDYYVDPFYYYDPWYWRTNWYIWGRPWGWSSWYTWSPWPSWYGYYGPWYGYYNSWYGYYNPWYDWGWNRGWNNWGYRESYRGSWGGRGSNVNNSAANTNGRSYAGNFGRSGSNGRQTGWSNRTFQGADTYNNGGRSFSGSIRWNNTNNRTLPNRSFNGNNGSRSNQGQSVDGRRFGNGSSTRVTPTGPARTFESQPSNTRTFQGGSNRSFGGGGTVSSGSNRSFGGGGTGGGRSFGGRR